MRKTGFVTKFAAVAVSAALAGALSVAAPGGAARAEDKPGGNPPAQPEKPSDKPNDKPNDKGDVGGMKVSADPQTRVEQAKRLVQELEIALAAAKAAKPVNEQLVSLLASSLDSARKVAQPVTKLSQLTEDEKKALGEELRKEAGEGGDKEPAPGADWGKSMLENMKTKAFDGVEMSESEQGDAEKIIGDWWGQNSKAWGERDSKKISDLKRDRDAQLEKLLGKKRSQKVINNLNSLGGGRR